MASGRHCSFADWELQIVDCIVNVGYWNDMFHHIHMYLSVGVNYYTYAPCSPNTSVISTVCHSAGTYHQGKSALRLCVRAYLAPCMSRG